MTKNWSFLFSSAYFSLSNILALVTQVEETSREREERLKGWGSFLGDEKASAEDKADPSKAAEQQNSSIQAAAEQNRQQEQANESTAKPQEGKDEKEEEEEEGVESTDSSLAGSDNEDA